MIRQFPILRFRYVGYVAYAALSVWILWQMVVHFIFIRSDSFGRLVTGGWGSADIGGAYSLEGATSAFHVNDSVGTMTLAAPNMTHSAYLAGLVLQDMDVSFRIKTDKPVVGGGQMVYLVARQVNVNTEYLARLRFAKDGRVRLQALRHLGDHSFVLGPEKTAPGVRHVQDHFIRLRVQVSGTDPTTIRMKAWADGQSEPSAWQYQASDAAPALQQGGAVGVRAYLSKSASNAPVVFALTTCWCAATCCPGSTEMCKIQAQKY